MNKENIIAKISKSIISARKNNLLITNTDDFNFDSLSLSDAYKVQKKVIEGLSKEIIGWKLGGTNQKTRDVFNVTEPYWGPIFSGDLYTKSSEIIEIPSESFVCGEVEFAIQISNDINRDNYKELLDGDVYYLMNKCALSMELPWSVYTSVSNLGVNALVCDCCATGKSILWEPLEYQEALELMQKIEVTVNGSIVAKGGVGILLASPLDTLREFIRLSIEEGVKLSERQWVFTGGVTSCVKLYFNNNVVMVGGNGESFSFNVC